MKNTAKIFLSELKCFCCAF